MRSEGGHRLFRPETLERLTLIDVYKASRLRLDEIRRLLDEPVEEHATQVAEIDDQLTRLSAEVSRMRAQGVPARARVARPGDARRRTRDRARTGTAPVHGDRPVTLVRHTPISHPFWEEIVNITATRITTQVRTWALIAGLSALIVVVGGQFLGGGSSYLLFAA